MLPEAQELEDALRAFFAREGARSGPHDGPQERPPSAAAVRIALREADHLAEDVYDAPAALLYALARQDRAPRAVLDRAVGEATLEAARRLGFRLDLEVGALAEIAAAARAGRSDYQAVRAALATHLDPFGG